MRDKKGCSIIDFPDNYVILDLETSGFDTQYDSIVEVCVLKIQNDTIIDSFCSFVNPNSFINYDFVEKKTGIKKSDLDNAPEFSAILPAIKEIVGENIIIGHNINFDINFLYDNSDEFPKNDFIDTLRLSRMIHKELLHHRLCDIADYYSINYDRLHRSLDDCKITFEIYKALKKDFLSNYSDCEDFLNKQKQLRKKCKKGFLNPKDIVPTSFEFDEDNILYNKNVVFTGVLEKMKRADAMQLVVNIGGHNQNSVTRDTNFLILGNNSYCSSIKDGKSSKHKKAEKLKLEGYDIEVISENTFYDIILE